MLSLETSQFISNANELIGFYLMATNGVINAVINFVVC